MTPWLKVAAALALLALGWQINAWRNRAIDADVVEAELKKEIEAHERDMAKAEEDRDKLAVAEAQVLDLQERERIELADLKKRAATVPLKDAGDCSFGPDSIRLLNDAGGYNTQMPDPASEPTEARSVSRTDCRHVANDASGTVCVGRGSETP